MRRRAASTVTSEPFRTIVADPPWPYGDNLPKVARANGNGAERGALGQYGSVMNVHEIARYLGSREMIEELAKNGSHPGPLTIADDSRLFLWRVAPMQEEALHVMRAWGFGAPVSEVVWNKVDKFDTAVLSKMEAMVNRALRTGDQHELVVTLPNLLEEARRLSFGMGRTFRMSHETCLVGRRGRPEVLSKSIRSVFFAPVGAHSQKPEAFYEMVEKLSPGPYLELFAAGHRRPGWTCLGDDHRAPALDEEPSEASG